VTFHPEVCFGALKGALKEGHVAVEELASCKLLLNEVIENKASFPAYSVSHIIH
jgi:hypothetical protein